MYMGSAKRLLADFRPVEYVYSDAERVVVRRALARATTSAALMAKARAIETMLRDNIPGDLERIRRELKLIVDTPIVTYQAGQAAAKAAKVLGVIDGQPDEEWPSQTPDAPAGPDYWPGRDDPFSDLDTTVCIGWGPDGAILKPVTQGDRDQWRIRVQGPPPWRRGQPVVLPEDESPPEDEDEDE
jgi:hypothetical protein